MADTAMGERGSPWSAGGDDQGRYGPLAEDASADVCVVGAGIAGLTTAYLLAREGRSVIVLEDGVIGAGMTGATTAHLTYALDDRYANLEGMHGEEGARLAAESHAAAVDKVEEIAWREGIDCGLARLDGYLFSPPGATADLLDEELAALHRAGMTAVERLDRAPIRDFDTGPALRFPRQAQIEPLRYLAGLARAILAAGGRIHTGTHVTRINGGMEAQAVTKGGALVTAGAVVVATNSPINDRLVIHTKQAGYTTYVIALRAPSGAAERALFWDTGLDAAALDGDGPIPYHYVRLAQGAAEGGGDLLVVGGEDHKTGQLDGDAEARYARLETWARERWPDLGEVERHWSGQVMEPVDGLAFIGPNPLDQPNVFVVTGDSGNGMTHGTIAGILLTDLIQGRPNPWAALYDPSRKTLSAAGTFARENLNVAGQMVKGYLSQADEGDAADIAPGHGAILRRGLLKVAAYRDEDGTLHEHSAICTHLGCVVAWNADAKHWDCPCHGSIFDKFGKVLSGPAFKDLGEVEGPRAHGAS